MFLELRTVRRGRSATPLTLESSAARVTEEGARRLRDLVGASPPADTDLGTVLLDLQLAAS